MSEVEELREEVARLKAAAVELTAAMKLLTEQDDRALTFVNRVEELLGD